MSDLLRPLFAQSRRVPGLLVMLSALILAGIACSQTTSSADVIYITATPLYDTQGNIIIPPTMTADAPTNTPSTRRRTRRA